MNLFAVIVHFMFVKVKTPNVFSWENIDDIVAITSGADDTDNAIIFVYYYYCG
jgi:hypothetical protein